MQSLGYIPLVNSSQFYTFYLNGILVGYNKHSLTTKMKGYIDTTREYTVLPKETYKLLTVLKLLVAIKLTYVQIISIK